MHPLKINLLLYEQNTLKKIRNNFSLYRVIQILKKLLGIAESTATNNFYIEKYGHNPFADANCFDFFVQQKINKNFCLV